LGSGWTRWSEMHVYPRCGGSAAQSEIPVTRFQVLEWYCVGKRLSNLRVRHENHGLWQWVQPRIQEGTSCSVGPAHVSRAELVGKTHPDKTDGRRSQVRFIFRLTASYSGKIIETYGFQPAGMDTRVHYLCGENPTEHNLGNSRVSRRFHHECLQPYSAN
jgi:hypothetical protein